MLRIGRPQPCRGAAVLPGPIERVAKKWAPGAEAA